MDQSETRRVTYFALFGFIVIAIVGVVVCLSYSNNTDVAQAYIRRGLYYHYDQKHLDLAIADFDKAIILSPSSSEAYVYRGNVYSEKEDFTRAITDYTKAIELNPNDLDAHVNRGSAYTAEKNFDRAIVDYDEAIAIHSRYVGGATGSGALKERDLLSASFPIFLVYNSRGNVYYQKKDFDLAIADYSKAIKLNPMDAAAYEGRALAYKTKGDFVQAKRDQKRATSF